MATGLEHHRLSINRRFGTVLCEPEWSWRPSPDTLFDFDLWFVWSGRGTMRCGEREIPLAPGACFCLRPRGDYHATHDPQHRLGVCYLHFDFRDEAGLIVHPPPQELPPLHAALDEVEFYERLLRQAVALAETAHPLRLSQAARYAHGVLLAMRERHLAPVRAHPVREQHALIAAITRQIRQNPGEMPTVERMADRAGYSVDHFTRLFSEVVGVAPKEFCIRVRLERAQHLLRESHLSIEQIARSLGYVDIFFFSRQFKSRMGLPPSQWRRQPPAPATS